ncbi:MAG: bifunctional 2',3'-cyclic-nucleotide 2'-phosphodiesterase/3'-nucleotidase [Clostridium sp.]|nr:bifunctional 2',3'-cyclic-nucleotide 2'-phosphodiesterase/3'-nucleotidase [Clostridium sp.]
MKTRKLKQICALICTGLMCLSNISGCGENTSGKSGGSNDNIELTIMGTSDVHNYLMNYDYYTTSESEKNGLVKISTIIKQYRKDSEEKNKKDIDNVVVFDNGDLIQGNPLGDYFARVQAVQSGTEHPVYKALNIAGYDGATLGNHEFNYGLDYLHQIINDSKVPVINTNIYNAQTKEPEFKQYEIIDKKVVDDSGNEKELKIGVLGFVPPQILEWDKINLQGKIEVKDIVESAKEMVPKVKDEGADVIVALSHSGYGNDNYIAGEENESYELTKVEGIDAVIAGHAHDTFPSEGFVEDNKDLPNVDVTKGTMNGVPTFEPAKYAEGVGVIKLTLSQSDDKYSVSDGTAEFIGVENVENDAELVNALQEDHDEVIAYVNSPVGKTLRDINTYFALVSDNDAVQLISDAQIEYAKNKVNEETSLSGYKDLPILSAAAPFKAGLSKDGTKADDYVEIKAGDVSIKDMANIYKYPNTAVIMKLNGKEIRNWLEMCAGLFNTIDVNSDEKQELLNKNYPAFNFDTLDGVTYEIDVTQAPKYDTDGNLINENSNRIVNLKYNGNDVKDEDQFLVITNNYRASGGGNFPIFNSDDAVLYISSDETRQIVTNYVKEKGTIDISADNNWKLKNTQTKGKVIFLSSTSAQGLSEAYPYISVDEAEEDNITEYIYDLSK